MNQKRGIAFILAGIFLLLYYGVHGAGLATLGALSFYLSPILCIIGFILAMLKD